MSLVGDVFFGVIAVGAGVAKVGLEAVFGVAEEAQRTRERARGMSDQQLLNGYMHKSNSLGARAGYGA
ncbi:MAG: hypothetical protein IJG32_09415, partial [Selenomonadaceae bacterium]|nr:hypothetical protein [Selenomonadaceae bacterium]